MLKLYSYFRSSAAYRVRIALGLKGLAWETQAINLLAGEQREEDYHAINPQGLVPALVTEGTLLTQSLAIIEYLEEVHPQPPLLPEEPLTRARVRSLAHLVAIDIHPLNNLRVMRYLGKDLAVDRVLELHWYKHWIAEGFAALEIWLEKLHSSGRFCVGDSPGLADICLIPQVYNARRYDCDLAPYPLISSIDKHCRNLPAFRNAAPESQPDLPEEEDALP